LRSDSFDEAWKKAADTLARANEALQPASYKPNFLQERMKWATMRTEDRLASAVPDFRPFSPVVREYRSPLTDALEELRNSRISNVIDFVNQSSVANVGEAIAHTTSQARSPIDWSAWTNPSGIDWSTLANLNSALTDWSEVGNRLLPPVNLDGWKSVAYDVSLAFNVRRPETERAIYQAARPEIVDVAQQLREMYDFSKLKLMTTWLDSPFIADSITIDLPSVFDLPDEPVVTIPRQAPRRHRKKRKPPEFVAPIDQIDTTTSQDKQPLIPIKRVVKEMSDTTYTVVVIGGCSGAGALTDGFYGAVGGAMIGTITVVVSMRDKP
jgi:hypothetical protein